MESQHSSVSGLCIKEDQIGNRSNREGAGEKGVSQQNVHREDQPEDKWDQLNSKIKSVPGQGYPQEGLTVGVLSRQMSHSLF